MARKNKTKEELVAEIKSRQKIEHIKDVVRKLFPYLDVPTIYDAQTTLSAIVGFIKADLEEKRDAIKFGDIKIDLSKEKESPITLAIKAISDTFPDEPAQDFSEILDRLSRAFGEYGSMKFVKGPMADLKIDDILAE